MKNYSRSIGLSRESQSRRFSAKINILRGPQRSISKFHRKQKLKSRRARVHRDKNARSRVQLCESDGNVYFTPPAHAIFRRNMRCRTPDVIRLNGFPNEFINSPGASCIRDNVFSLFPRRTALNLEDTGQGEGKAGSIADAGKTFAGRGNKKIIKREFWENSLDGPQTFAEVEKNSKEGGNFGCADVK